MKREYGLMFAIFSILTFGNVNNLCRSYMPLLFDNQILLSWQKWAEIGLIPYRDIYYQYGILPYYKGHMLVFTVLYLLVAPLIFTFLYFIFRKVFRDRSFALLSIIFVFFFVYRFIGFELFSRYGIFVGFGILVSLVLYETKKNIIKSKILLLGILAGIIFPLFNDQGIYSAVLFAIMIVVDSGLRGRLKSVGEYLNIIINWLIFGSGFLIGFIPYGVYLVSSHSLTPFINSFFELSDLQQIAKIPYFHGFASIDNVFTIVVMLLTLISICYRIYQKNKPSLLLYVQLGVFLVLLILEQKNVWRHIDTQLTFIGILLFLFLLNQIWEFLEKKVPRKYFLIYSLNIFIFILFIAGFHNFTPVVKLKVCASEYKIFESRFNNVKKIITSDSKFNGKIFSFPGDTVFYLVFNQIPPYYPTTYEGSSLSGQKKTVTYIEKNKINYIVYNYKNTSIQDGVPNYIRTPILHQYIMSNFSIVSRSGDFLVLKRSMVGFLENRFLNQIPEFKKYLLNVDLANIPRSEGLYKDKYLFSDQVIKIYSVDDINMLNKFLITRKVHSENLLVSVEYKNNLPNKDNTSISIYAGEYKTNISYYKCQSGHPCIINLENIPLFAADHTINKISIEDTDEVKNISLYKTLGSAKFW